MPRLVGTVAVTHKFTRKRRMAENSELEQDAEQSSKRARSASEVPSGVPEGPLAGCRSPSVRRDEHETYPEVQSMIGKWTSIRHIWDPGLDTFHSLETFRPQQAVKRTKYLEAQTPAQRCASHIQDQQHHMKAPSPRLFTPPTASTPHLAQETGQSS